MIVITGGRGFIGSHLVKYFSAESFDIIEGQDINNRAQLLQIPTGSTIFHLAAVSTVPDCEKFPLEAVRTNILGTAMLLEMARKKDWKIIFTSSSAVYGDGNPPFSERSPTNPKSIYGITKLAAEHLLKHYATTYGLDVLVFRLFNVYGVGGKGVIPIFLKCVLLGKPVIVYGNGRQIRDYIYIDDVIRAFELALSRRWKGEVINIGTGKPTSVLEVIETIEKVTGRTVQIEYAPPRKGDVKESWASVELAMESLGFEAQIGLEEGIRRMLNKIES